MGLLSSTNKGGDRRDTEDGAARRVLGGHLPGCGLYRVERAIEICADGCGEEVGFYATMRVSALSVHRCSGEEVLEELSELADACIADEDVECSPSVDHIFNQILARRWVRDVSCNGDELCAILW